MPTPFGCNRIRRWLSCGIAGIVLVSAACSDQSPSETVTGPVGPSAQKHPSSEAPADTYIQHKKNGKAKRYRVKVDKASGTINLESVQTMDDPGTGGPVDWCEPGDPGCVSGECAITDPTCGRMYGEDDITGQTNVSYSGSPAYEVAEGEYGPYYCPAYIDDPHFTWRGHHFEVNGRIFKQPVILPSPSGLPRARYLLPNGPWYSDDGDAVIYSGTIDATCFIRDHKIMGLTVTEGWVTYGAFKGDAKERGGSASSGSGSWVSYGGSGSYMDSGAASALNAFLENGSCTEGWAIYVDGVKYC